MIGVFFIILGTILIVGACYLIYRYYNEFHSDKETESRLLVLKTTFKTSILITISGLIIIFIGVFYIIGLFRYL